MHCLDSKIRKEIVDSTVELVTLLSENDLKIIENVLLTETNISFAKIKKNTGISGPQADMVASFLKNLQIGKEILLISLQTALATRDRLNKSIDSCDLIWTGPIQFPIPARSTMAVINEMIENAKDSVILVGYRIEEYAEPIIRSLYVASKRNVRIIFVLDRTGYKISIFKSIWKKDDLPEIYFRKIDKKDPMASIHAKLIIVDSNSLLITSANLTYHGLNSNLEIGVRIKGKIAGNAERLIDALISKKYLVPI